MTPAGKRKLLINSVRIRESKVETPINYGRGEEKGILESTSVKSLNIRTDIAETGELNSLQSARQPLPNPQPEYLGEQH